MIFKIERWNFQHLFWKRISWNLTKFQLNQTTDRKNGIKFFWISWNFVRFHEIRPREFQQMALCCPNFQRQFWLCCAVVCKTTYDTLFCRLLCIAHCFHIAELVAYSTQREYRKVASSRLSQLVAHSRIFRLFMKGKFDAYVLWPLAKRVQNWIVDRSTARNFTVVQKDSKMLT